MATKQELEHAAHILENLDGQLLKDIYKQIAIVARHMSLTAIDDSMIVKSKEVSNG